MLQKETTITGEHHRYDKYCSKLPGGIADQIIASARMQKKLQAAAPFMFDNVLEMVRECSEHRTSHPAIIAMSVNHGANIVPPHTATVPMPVGTEPMHLTVANANTRCYRSNGSEHEAQDCATLDTWGHCQAYHTRPGVNCSRRDGGCNRTNTCCGSAGTSTRSAAGGIINIRVAKMEDASRNDDREDSAVEQKVEV